MSAAAPNNQAQAPQQVTVQQLALMSPAQRAAILAGQPDAVKSAWGQYQTLSNSMYLANTFIHEAVCPMSNGGATSQQWVSNSTLYYTVPIQDFSYLETIRVFVSVSLTTASAGTVTATYATNYGFPLNLFDDIQINLGNSQWDIPAYVLRDFWRFYGNFSPIVQPRFVVIAGQPFTNANLATFRSNISGDVPGTFALGAVGTPAPLRFFFDIPLKLIHAMDPRGMLPMFSNGVQLQVLLHCNGAVLGQDPLLNVVANTNLGTTNVSGQAVTVANVPYTPSQGIQNVGVECHALYRDGKSPRTNQRMALFLSNLGTMQFMRDQTLPQLQANQRMMQRIFKSSPRIYYAVSYIVDGNQSNIPCANTNIVELLMATDQTGDNPLFHYGGSTNVSPMSFFQQISDELGFDTPDGVIPWIHAQSANQIDAANQEGTMVLDNSQSGYTSIFYGGKVATIGNGTGALAGINPRIETYLAFLNPQGLQIAGLS